jgi:hypothetical protein
MRSCTGACSTIITAGGHCIVNIGVGMTWFHKFLCISPKKHSNDELLELDYLENSLL